MTLATGGVKTDFNNTVETGLQLAKDKGLGDALVNNNRIAVEKALAAGANPDGVFVNNQDITIFSGATFLEAAAKISKRDVILTLLRSDKIDLVENNRDVVEIVLTSKRSPESKASIIYDLVHAGADINIVQFDPSHARVNTVLDRYKAQAHNLPSAAERKNAAFLAQTLENSGAKTIKEIRGENKTATLVHLGKPVY